MMKCGLVAGPKKRITKRNQNGATEGKWKKPTSISNFYGSQQSNAVAIRINTDEKVRRRIEKLRKLRKEKSTMSTTDLMSFVQEKWDEMIVKENDKVLYCYIILFAL